MLTIILITVIMLVFPRLLPMKGLNYLDSIPQVMQHEELMLRQFLVFRLSISSVSGGGRTKKTKFRNVKFVCLTPLYTVTVSSFSEKEMT